MPTTRTGLTRPGPTRSRLASGLATLLLAACAGPAGGPALRPAVPADFEAWPCVRIQDEIDAVQHRAANLAWRVDRRAGQHIVELGLGLAVYWPALQALQSEGADARSLDLLKQRDDALRTAAERQSCPATAESADSGRRPGLPVRPGERLVYEEQGDARDPLHDLTMTIVALRRNEIEFASESGGALADWRQDMAGNVIEAPPGALRWRQLLHQPLALGDVVADELRVGGQPSLRARVRGQVVATGPLRIAGRPFDAAVIQLFGDVPARETGARLEGSLVVDRAAGLLLRLELRSAQPEFRLQRRLVRVDGPH